ncbi:MAG TPA: hypothetical protein EYG68_02600 [Leucothrix mucor]|nr:hypothetical protein [Leucothrix mucor]
MNKSLLSITIGLILGVGASLQVYADVLSNVVPADLVEPIGLYDLSNPDVVLMTAKTVISNAGVCQKSDDYANCTLADIIADLDATDDFKPEIKVLLTTNELAPDENASNATMRLRGQASRYAPQKSFRIKLNSKKKLWRGERRIQLIKSVFDFTRIRNALSYELLTSIPALPSLRTQFVDLEVDDGTSTDYGIYTHVEHVGKEFLVNRGWDKDSPIYKAEHFAFKNKDVYKLDDAGKPLDKDAFEKNLEIKRGKNHSKLAEMLAALNDSSVDFNTQVMGKYFNQENYLSWFAFNILINNTDTENKNFYLYNPKGKDAFYLMSWDNDFAWGASLEDPASTIDQWPRWWFSQANWWDIKLHQRFLEQEGNLELLKSAVTEMRNKYLTPAKIKAITDKYYPLVFPRATTNPDLEHLYVRGDTEADKKTDYTLLVNQLKNNVEQNYQLFMQRADDPMTFYLDDSVVLTATKAEFNWDSAISLSKHGITYDLEVATTPTFTTGSVLEKITNIPSHRLDIPWNRVAGTYYYRVTARDVHDPELHFQVAKNEADDLFYPGTEVPIYGVVKFTTQTGGNGDPQPANVSPSAEDQTASTTVDSVVLISLKGTDSDSDNLSYTVVESPAHGTLSGNGKNLQYTPATGYKGTDNFRYVVGDGKAFSRVAVVSINIGEVVSDPIISNPVNSNTIRIDGKVPDWQGVTLFKDDVDGAVISTDSKIDWKSAGIAHSDTDVYLAYHNKKVISSDLEWGWQTFMDTDNKHSTGYKINAEVGADYLMEGETLFRYVGDGENWLWKTVGKVFVRYSGKDAELRFPRQWIANPNQMKVVYLGNNEAYGGSFVDVYPETPAYFNYKFSLSTTGNHKPRIQSQSAVTNKNTNKTIELLAYDVDLGDVLTYEVIKQVAHGSITISGKTVVYTPTSGFTGTDNFTYRVHDGAVNSEIATVSITVADSSNGEISNAVSSNSMTVDGSTQDWAALNNFPADSDSLGAEYFGEINWNNASMAHSDNTLYLLYGNKKAVSLPLEWGWQAFLDTDVNPATGYKLSNGLGADYILEGNALLRYTGTGDDWSWQYIADTSIAASGNDIELSFPRSLIADPAMISVAFFGNNDAYAQGGASDAYPENALDTQQGVQYFSYRLGGVGTSGAAKAVQKNYASPVNHQPSASSVNHKPKEESTVVSPPTATKKGGGTISWGLFALLTSLIAIRRRYLR